MLVVCTNRAWKNEALLRQLVSAPEVAQIKEAVLAHCLFQDLVISATQSSDFAPRAAITAIRTLFSEIAIALAPQAKDSKGSVLSARALHVAERPGAAHVPSLSQEIREDDEQVAATSDPACLAGRDTG